MVILSTRLWDRTFGRDEAILGRVITLDEVPHEVVGVMPPAFQFPGPEAELWTPLGVVTSPNSFIDLGALARLKDGVTVQQAEAEGTTLVQQLEAERPIFRPSPERPPPAVMIVPLYESMVADFRGAMVVLWVAVGFVLIVACANLANLVLARGTVRQREMAIRSAIGAGRARLVRQLLTESLVLSVAGGAAGLLVALGVLGALPAIAPQELPRIDDLALDPTVLGFALLISIVTGPLFAIIPALQGSRLDVVDALRGGSGQATGGFRLLGPNRARSAFAIIEVGLALILLIGATVLAASFMRLVTTDPGYDPANVLTARLHLGPRYARQRANQSTDEDRSARWRALPLLFERIANRTAALPGIRHAGVVSFLPLDTGWVNVGFQIERQQIEADRANAASAFTQIVTPGYFEAMGMRSVEGRLFTADDRAGGAHVVVVNETFARTLFPGESVVRRRLSFRRRTQGRQWFEIVGVLRDVRHNGLDAESRPEVYFPATQAADLVFGTDSPFVVLKTSGDPAAALPALRQALYEIDPMVVIQSAMTMETRLSTSVAQPRFYVLLFSAFSLLALVLASVGLYGVLSYVVAQRRREIGIRMALGAGRGQVVRLVLQQAFALIAAGTVLGLAAAWGLSRLLDHQLFGVATADRTTHVVAVLLLAAVGAMACYAPARRASRVDPAVALRAE